MAELLVGIGSGEVEVTLAVFKIVPGLADGFTIPTSVTAIVSPGVKLPGVQVMVLVPVHVPFVAEYD